IGEVSHDALSMWLGAANALLLTSSREGRPNVVLEALSSGLPVVATQAGGTSEILPPELLALSRDAEEIGSILSRVLRLPPESAKLQEKVADLTWDASYSKLEGYLERVLLTSRS
ncbi:MAG: glycosyltransferase, partial [Gammaproteobacteria bacterium]|nr:glycosyltransferase [Gammaproteobacteria bacterium]